MFEKWNLVPGFFPRSFLLVFLLSGAGFAQDWPQWRGPTRSGTVPKSPPLVETWEASGPKQLWRSEKILSGKLGGYGSVSVADGRAYLFASWKTHTPTPQRVLTKDALKSLGGSGKKLPADLAGKVETARTSQERSKLKRPKVSAWTKQWIEKNLSEDQKKQFGRVVRVRLTGGRRGLSPSVLDKLGGIAGRTFPSQEELDKWFGDNDISGKEKDSVMRTIPTGKDSSQDTLFCLDAADGKTLWKSQHPGVASKWGSSCTPCIVDGKCYVTGTSALYCFDAVKGKLEWKAAFDEKTNPVDLFSGRNSSPLVLGDRVLIQAGVLRAYRTADGEELWSQPKLKGNNSSPVIWEKDGKSYVLCNSGREIACVNPEDGKILWTVAGGGSSSPVIQGDLLLVLAGDEKIGLIAYTMTPDGATEHWAHKLHGRGASPVVGGGNVYTTGESKKIACYALKDGKLRWEQKLFSPFSSPVLVDGKLLVITAGGKNLCLIKASPEKYEKLADWKTDITDCTSPAIVEGRLFLRHKEAVVCYDLRANP